MQREAEEAARERVKGAHLLKALQFLGLPVGIKAPQTNAFVLDGFTLSLMNGGAYFTAPVSVGSQDVYTSFNLSISKPVRSDVDGDDGETIWEQIRVDTRYPNSDLETALVSFCDSLDFIDHRVAELEERRRAMLQRQAQTNYTLPVAPTNTERLSDLIQKIVREAVTEAVDGL